MPRYLGVSDGQTCGAAVIEDGRILAAVNEERIVRVKMARGFPKASINEVLRLTDTRPEQLAGVCVGQANMELREEIAGWPGWFEARDDEQDIHATFFRLASRFGSVASRFPFLRKIHYWLRTPAYKHRRKRVAEILSEMGISAPTGFFDHHLCHAASAYYTSPFDDCLVVTMDGGGDGSCSHVYEARNGRLKLLSRSDSFDSLGNFYAYVTVLCGFKAKRHEGKITGLAVHGQPLYRELLAEMIDGEDGRLINRSGMLFHGALRAIRDRLPQDWDRADLAASIQSHCESVTRDYVKHWLRESGLSKVAMAGGLFANVRINEEVLDLPEVDGIFVHPGMSDEGLAVGAGLAAWAEEASERGAPSPPTLMSNVYLGTSYDGEAIHRAVENSGLSFQHLGSDATETVARKLSEGNVVARFAGAMEYGPRALGNRSILYRPDDPSVNTWLNELLKRTEFMPFAPSCLDEYSEQLFENAAGARTTARFMTTTFHCTPWMQEHCPGVVHLDGTARPQLVRREDNPEFWELIDAFREQTGIPAVINTSFNIHEEPIVRSPEDAIRAFTSSRLDYLVLGDFLIEGSVGTRETKRQFAQRNCGESR